MDKVCTTCRRVKDSERDFSKDVHKKDGRRCICRECIRKKRLVNREKTQQKRKLKREQIECLLLSEAHIHIYCNFNTGILYKKSTDAPLLYNVSPKKYIYVNVLGVAFRAHRLVWLLAHNEWPECIDHIDGDTLNNKLSNLRNCNSHENQCNQYNHRNGKLPGCYFQKKTGKWNVQFHHNKIHKYLGLYSTEKEASLVYCRYVLKHGLVRREFLPSIFTDDELYSL